jgi:hypothetical protein
MIRSFLPTDLLVISFQRGSLSDVARTKDNMGEEGARFLGLAGLSIKSLNPRGKRRTWVRTEGLRFGGLASVRDRSLPSVWEIEHLILNHQDAGYCLSLLERLSIAGVELGVTKIFLRLPADNPLLAVANEAGFCAYLNEHLYSRERKGSEAESYKTSPIPFPRRKRVNDDYRLFELYQKCVPASVRGIEGMTFGEWQAGKEREMGAEWVFEAGSVLVGWLGVKTKRDMGQFEIMAISAEELEPVVEYGLMFLSDCRQILCPVPEFQWDLFRVLEKRGFGQVAKCCALAKEPVDRVKRTCLIPASA